MTIHEQRDELLSSRQRKAGRPALAQALGWFSIGLGAAEVAMPGTLSRLIGVRGRHRALVRSMGMREIAAGVGILAKKRPAEFLWARVAGDAIDLSLLGLALSEGRTRKTRAAIATAAVAGVTALDVICGAKLLRDEGPVLVRESIAVNKTPEECYRLWRNFESLPQFLRHVESVTKSGERRLHWRVRAPMGMRVEWDAEITEDQANERIAWRSVEGSDIENRGEVRFERGPGGRGTMVRVELLYDAPGGRVGSMFAKLSGEEPSQQAYDDLRNFKKLIETGEIITTEGQPSRRQAFERGADRREDGREQGAGEREGGRAEHEFAGARGERR